MSASLRNTEPNSRARQNVPRRVPAQLFATSFLAALSGSKKFLTRKSRYLFRAPVFAHDAVGRPLAGICPATTHQPKLEQVYVLGEKRGRCSEQMERFEAIPAADKSPRH